MIAHRISPPAVKVVAMEIAKIGEKGGIDELIRISDGGKFTSATFRNTWFSGPKLVSEKYWECRAQYQIAAIEALGNSANRRALDFITEFGRWELNEGSMPHCMGGRTRNGQFSIDFQMPKVICNMLWRVVGMMKEGLQKKSTGFMIVLMTF